MYEISKEHKGNYGYRRITIELRKRGFIVNHKKVLRIMRLLGITCMKFSRKSRKYSSYRGKIGKVAKNTVNRRFTMPYPLK